MAKLTSMHFYAWKSGLKTGMYYLRTKSAVDAIKFTLNVAKTKVSKPATASVTATAATASSPAPSQLQATAVEPLTPQELKQMLEQSKSNEDDDCLMCGS